MAARRAIPPPRSQGALRRRRPTVSCALGCRGSLVMAVTCDRKSGGSVWESNPPPTCLEPDAGFEVRGVHRRRKRFRSAHCAPDPQKECTIGGPNRAECPIKLEKCHHPHGTSIDPLHVSDLNR